MSGSLFNLPVNTDLLSRNIWREIEELRCALNLLRDQRGFIQFTQQGVLLGRAQKGVLPIEYLTVGGGGGGGLTSGAGGVGGGGGGGNVSGTLTALVQPGATLLATIGIGGNNSQAGSSSFNGSTYVGGGHGSDSNALGTGENGQNGAAGGGGGFNGATGVGGTGSPGGNGGNAAANGGGGGGGRGGAGGHGSGEDGGVGGSGISNSITGAAVIYGAGGGGGGSGVGVGAPGGSSGAGGSGSDPTLAAGSGTTPGSGGGGAGENGTAGAGAHGALYVRNVGDQRATGGTVSDISAGGIDYKLHSFALADTGTNFVVEPT